MSDLTKTHSEFGSSGGTRSAPVRLILAMHYQRPLAPPRCFELSTVREVVIGRGRDDETEEVLLNGRVGLRINVPADHMSTDHLRLSLEAGVWIARDLGSKNGTGLNGTPIQEAVVRSGDLLEVGGTMFVFRAEAGEIPSEGADGLAVLRTFRPALAEQFARLRRSAGAGVPVLIEGATGTGKELLARAVHTLSGRTGPFVAVNCGAIPDQLVEAALFGNLRGAFSGAERASEGFVRAADGGTLFLDEVAELAPSSQTALLRVLQEHEVTPVGATSPIAVDLRVVAATHRDLPALVERGEFREDLYARLAGFVAGLPQLVERPEDIGLLIAELLRRHGAPDPARWSFRRRTGQALFRYAWPRNVRELEAALRSAMALSDGAIALDHLPEAVVDAGESPPEPALSADEATQRSELVRLLELHAGNVSAVARDFGRSRQHLHRMLRRFALDPDRYRNGAAED